MSDRIRRRVLFSGQVQGVGFRYTALRISRGYDVSGFVRNLADGRVELVAEGSSDDVHRFIDEVQRAMAPYIGDVSSTDEPATGTLTAFTIGPSDFDE